MSRRRKPLVPDSQSGLDMLKARLVGVFEPEEAKYKVASALQIPLQQGDNGDVLAKDAGKVGGKLGGPMVKELVRSAQGQWRAPKD